MGCGIGGTRIWALCSWHTGHRPSPHLRQRELSGSPLLCRCRGRCVCRALVNSQGRQLCFEAAEVSELFSWLLRSPKDRERGRASNDEFNPALFEVPGRNSQHQLWALCGEGATTEQNALSGQFSCRAWGAWSGDLMGTPAGLVRLGATSLMDPCSEEAC